MLIFSVYTFAVWWMAFHRRRRWSGLLAVLAGLGGMLLAHRVLMSLEGTRTGYPMTGVLFLSYAAMLFIGGVYIVALPRRVSVHTCDRCGYELTGLPAADNLETARCPECGAVGSVITPGSIRRSRRSRNTSRAKAPVESTPVSPSPPARAAR